MQKRVLRLSSNGMAQMDLTRRRPRRRLVRGTLLLLAAMTGVLLLQIGYWSGAAVAACAAALLVSWQPACGTREADRDTRRAVVGSLMAWSLTAVMLTLVFDWSRRTGDYQYLYLAMAAATPLMLMVHPSVRLCLFRFLEIAPAARSVVIAGVNQLSRQLAYNIVTDPKLGLSFKGFFDDRHPGRLGSPEHGEVKGRLADLADYVNQRQIDLIYIALPMVQERRILQLLEDLRNTTASVYFVPDIFVFDLIQARVANLNGIPALAVCETPFYGVRGVAKRLFDIVTAALILVMASPLMLGLALGVKLSSPGPVLFKQRRYGLGGEEIVVYKFRSMSVCEDGPEIAQATRGDARVTRFGAFLRRTSLDELPQFINVLQGHMSVVGPRPHAVAHNEAYRKLIRAYMLRHKVKPGITGWAQVHGLRGETASLDKMRARIDYDLQYLRQWSLVLDLKIIWKTFVMVLADRNAY